MLTMPLPVSSRSESPVPKENSTLRFASTEEESQTKAVFSPSSSQSMSSGPESNSVLQSPLINMEGQLSPVSSRSSSRAASPTLVDDTELHTRFDSVGLKGSDEQIEIIHNQATTIERLQEEREYYQEQYRAEKLSCQSKKDEIYQLTRDSNRQTKKFKALETEVASFKQMVKDRDLKIAEFEDKIKHQADGKDHSDQTISELRKDVEIIDWEAAGLQDELLDEPVDFCIAELNAGLVKKVEELQTALDMSQQEIDQVRSQFEASGAMRIGDDESSAEADANADLLKKVEELESALLESRQEQDRLKSQLEAKDAENFKTEQQLEEIQLSREEAEMEVEYLKEEIHRLFEQVERREEYIVESAKVDLEERQQLHDENLSLKAEIHARNELEKKSANASCHVAHVQSLRELPLTKMQAISREPYSSTLTKSNSTPSLDVQAEPQCSVNSVVDYDAYYKGDLQNASVFITIKPDNRKDWSLVQRIKLLNPSKLNIQGPADLVCEFAKGMKEIEKIYKEQIGIATYWENIALDLSGRHRSLEDDLEAMKTRLEIQERLLTVWSEMDGTMEKNDGISVEVSDKCERGGSLESSRL